MDEGLEILRSLLNGLSEEEVASMSPHISVTTVRGPGRRRIKRPYRRRNASVTHVPRTDNR